MVRAEGGDDSTFVDFQLETGNGGRDLNETSWFST